MGILQIIENFVIRRFVCNIPTNQLNKIFPQLYSQAQLKNQSDLLDGTSEVLQSRGYPKDTEFRARLSDAKLYGAGDRIAKTKLILETLEESYHHKEAVTFDNLTIEHVMPQTLTEWWQNHLGSDWQADHELYLNVVGNLTLTAYNPELSNDAFSEKRKYLAASHLELNKYFAQSSEWKRYQIEQRSKSLAEMALKVWPYFGDQEKATVSTPAVTGKTPHTVKICGQKISVNSWRGVQAVTMAAIAELEPESFTMLANEYPRFIGQDARRFVKAHKLDNGYYVEVNLSAKDVYRFCHQAIESIGLSSEDWQVEAEIVHLGIVPYRPVV